MRQSRHPRYPALCPVDAPPWHRRRSMVGAVAPALPGPALPLAVVVEDDPAVRALESQVLEEAGFRVWPLAARPTRPTCVACAPLSSYST